MTIDQIKEEALRYVFTDHIALAEKVAELKKSGVAFLGCVAFVQTNQDIPLNEARDLTLRLQIYNNSEKDQIEKALQLMMSEYEEDD